MLSNILRKSLVFFLCHTLAYAPLTGAAQLSLPSSDLVAPKISQEKHVDSVEKGTDHRITVTVTDNVGVEQVTLYYRSIGFDEYKRKSMINTVNTDYYHATIKSDEITEPGVEYYVQAVDKAGNTLLLGYSFSPLSVNVISEDTAVASPSSSTLTEAKEPISKWVWIGLGVLAVGLAAGGGGGGGGDSGDDSDNGTIIITGPTP